jgi:hypothetical protein
MTMTFRHLVVLATLTAGCDNAGRPPAFVIPGPTVPSPVPTAAPYVWDTRDELAIWIDNAVSRGSLALEGTGAGAFVRIDQLEREWVMRGPDLVPSATGVRTVRVRYRWRPDASLPPSAARTVHVGASFQTTAPLQPFYYGQGWAGATLEELPDWTDILFAPSQYTPPIDVSYCYLTSTVIGANRGVIEIDRIELVQ